MSTKIRKELFWGSVIGLFVFAPCWFFFLNQRGYETPFDNLEDIPKRTVDAILYGKEDPGEDASAYERLMSYDLLSPPEESIEERETEEGTAEVDAETERLANWKANFPYKPTTDPNLVITEEMLKPENMAEPPTRNHVYLRGFFENEARFTAQFEQLYHILEEHGRGDNPVASGKIFFCLWEYYQYSQKDPNELIDRYSNRMGRYRTNDEVAETYREGIVYYLHAERMWPDREFMQEDEAIALRDRIVNEIQGVDKIPDPSFLNDLSYEEELEVGFSPLVISPGWQAAYDEWDRRWLEIESEERQNRVMNVGEGNILMANGRPVISAEGDGFFAYITTPDGFQVPLIRGDNGEVIIPTPAEIEEMKANGEGEWVEIPERPAPPPPQLTEEEWKMQETLRQLEEAARQREYKTIGLRGLFYGEWRNENADKVAVESVSRVR